LLILKAQIFIVYFYGGVAKLNPDWLHGQPLSTLMGATPPTAYHGLGVIIRQPWFSYLVTFGGIAIDLSMGFLLWCSRTFWFGAFIALAFHLMNSILFPIGVFPWLMIATIGLFAAPDWPRKVFQKFKRGGSKLSATGDAASIGPTEEKSPASPASVHEPAVPVKQTNWTSRWATAGILVFFHVYLLFQILIPLRHYLYPGDVAWTEEGHRFSWRMMLRSKMPISFEYVVVNPSNQQSRRIAACSNWMNKVLNTKQQEQMVKRPDMILQFAHYIADTFEQRWHVRPIVKVEALENLNFRPAPQYLINPNVDLAALSENNLWMPAPWITPLQPLPADHRSYSGAIPPLPQTQLEGE
jgi:hypothetical protein